MPSNENTTSHALFNAFRQLRQVNWRGRSPVEGYTHSETIMLFCIRRRQKDDPAGVKSSELSQMMRVTQPTVSQMVNLLEARGALARTQDPGDRRAVRITLTEEGQRVTSAAEQAMNESLEGLARHLGEERTRLLIELIGEVQAYYSILSDEDGPPDCKATPKPFE